MGNELSIISESGLTLEEEKTFDTDITRYIESHKNNRQEINRLVFQSVAEMTESEAYEQQLSSKRGLRRILGNITGSNQALQNKINSSRAAAQFAAQTTIRRLAEQNILTFDLIQTVNNKLNSSVRVVEGEINDIYRNLQGFFRKEQGRIVKLEQRVAALEQNVKLLNWQNSIEYQFLGDVEYRELDDAAKIVCTVRDFYDITGGSWKTSDLLLLKTAMNTIGISPDGTISYQSFISRVAGDAVLLEKLFGGRKIERLPENYLVPLLTIKKRELLETDEAYVVDTLEESLTDNGVAADRNELESRLLHNYVAREAQVNLDTQINNFSLIDEMLFNLRSAEEAGLFDTEPAPVATEEFVNVPDENTDVEADSNDDADAHKIFVMAAAYYHGNSGNAKHANAKEQPPVAQGAATGLARALNSVAKSAETSEKNDFRFHISGFKYNPNGPAVSGTIESGQINAGDKIRIRSVNARSDRRTVTVTDLLSAGNTTIKSAKAGDYVTIALQGVRGWELEHGDVLCSL